MLKIQMIGYLGKDAVVQIHGTESVINFSLCHTDKYKDSSGQKYEKATWVSCSWWTESANVAQYLKKGTLIWAEGVPEAKNWKDKQGESKAFLNMRVMRIELLGGKRDDQSGNSTSANASDNSSSDDDLPF
jgi:single-strand DNA-binding protein